MHKSRGVVMGIEEHMCTKTTAKAACSRASRTVHLTPIALRTDGPEKKDIAPFRRLMSIATERHETSHSHFGGGIRHMQLGFELHVSSYVTKPPPSTYE